MDGQAKVSIWLELKNRLKSGLRDARTEIKGTLGDIKNDLGDISSGTGHITSDFAMLAGAFGVGTIAANTFMQVAEKIPEIISKIAEVSMDLDNRWQESFQHSNAILQVSQDKLSEYSERIQDIAKNQTNVPFETVPDAFNELVKSGQNAELAIKNLPKVLEAARVGFTDAGNAARVTADVMQAGAFKDAGAALDYMFNTMHKGNMDFKTMGNVLPLIMLGAKDANIQINEAAAALATLTSKGIDAGRASTMLDDAFRLFSDKRRTDKFSSVGIQIFDAKGEMRSLGDIALNFRDVMARLKSDKDKNEVLDFLGFDRKNARGFLTLAQDADLLRVNIDAANKAAGAMDSTSTAVEERFKGWNDITNTMKGQLGKLGDYLNDIKAKTGDNLSSFKDWLQHSESLKKVFELINLRINMTIELLKAAFTWQYKAVAEISERLKDIQPPKWLQYFTAPMTGLLMDFFEPSNLDKQNAAFRKEDQDYYKTHKDEVDTGAVQTVVDGFGFLKKTFDKIKYGGLSAEKIELVKAKETELYNAKHNTSKNLYDAYGNLVLGDGGGGGGSKSRSGDSGERIQGSVPRTVNFNIQSVISGDFITKNENFQNMSPQEFEKFLTNIFLRMRHNAEVGYN